MTSRSSLPTQGSFLPSGWAPTGPPASILVRASFFLSQQSKSAGSNFLVTLCCIQSAHKNMQTPSQNYGLSPSQISILVYFKLYNNNIMRYLQRKTFSSVICFLLLLLGWGFLFLCYGFGFDGDWSLRLSFDIFFTSEFIPQSPVFPSSFPPSPSLFLSVCVCLSGFPLLLFPFWFLVAGLHWTVVKHKKCGQ